MAYDPNRLSALAYADGFNLWRYKTEDTLHEMEEPGYFNPARVLVGSGDQCHFTTSAGTKQAQHGVLVFFIEPGSDAVSFRSMVVS